MEQNKTDNLNVLKKTSVSKDLGSYSAPPQVHKRSAGHSTSLWSDSTSRWHICHIDDVHLNFNVEMIAIALIVNRKSNLKVTQNDMDQAYVS